MGGNVENAGLLSLIECGFGGVGGGEDGGARKQRGNGQYLGGAGKERDLELTEVGGSFPWGCA